MKKEVISSQLFARPSAIEGVARLLDLGITLQEYNASETENEADAKALKSDWHAVGIDMKSAVKKYEQGLIATAR